MQSPICIVNFTNMLRSGWTWNNLWNLLNINLKYKCYHNLVQGFIFKGVSLHDWKDEKWLLKNVFVKLPCLWYDLIIIPHVKQPPNKLFPICHEIFFEKGPSILYGGGRYYIRLGMSSVKTPVGISLRLGINLFMKLFLL